MELVEMRPAESCLSIWNYIKLQGSRHATKIVQEDTATGEMLTFKQLTMNVERLALGLQQMDLSHGVGICSENNLEYCWVLLGALHAGARCTLLSPVYSARELRHFLQLTKPAVIFCSKSISQKAFDDAETFIDVCLEYPFVKTIYVWGTNEQSSNYVLLSSVLSAKNIPVFSGEFLDENRNRLFHDSSEALVLASSGSTGLPKGVVLTHKAVVESLKLSEIYARSGETALGLMPLFHAYGLILGLMCLCEGSRLVIVPKLTGSNYLAKVIVEYQINNLYLVPSLLATIGKESIFTLENLSCVKHLWTGAANISRSIQEIAKTKLPNALLHHSYGMTETTFVTLTGLYDKPGSPGKVVSNIECRIVKENTICGPDEPGELQFRGPTLLKEYLNDRQATEDAIFNGWLRSGDLGYYDKDGDFFIVDRIKELIKYQGHQVSPVEIEGIILTHPKVLEAAVVGLPDEHFGELPMAVIVVKENSTIIPDEIIEHVARQVSPHKKLRGGVRFFEKLPRTVTGKLQRKVLLAQILNNTAT